jgi:hypothetical protein
VTDHQVEVLAQAIWRGMFGERRVLQEWVDWAAGNGDAAEKHRAKAREMLGVAGAQGKSNDPRVTAHHSLGWLNDPV